jgi:hypothetical protein
MKDRFGWKMTVEVVTPMLFQEACMSWGKADPLSGRILIFKGEAEGVVLNFNRVCK